MLLLNLSWRAYSQHPWQSGLSLLGIALGIAIVVAIDITSESSRRGFERSLSVISGNTTHSIVGAAGSIPESTYAAIVTAYPDLLAAPIVEGTVRFNQAPSMGLTMIGVDPFATGPSSQLTVELDASADPLSLLLFDAMIIHRELATSLGVRTGDELALRLQDEDLTTKTSRVLTVAGVIETVDTLDAQALSRVVLVDISTAQKMLRSIGHLTRIDLAIDDSELINALAAGLPTGLQLVNSNAQQHAERQMTRAFETNLVALSLLALLIGAFLIYNAMALSVVRRRSQFGVMRSLGFTRADVFKSVMIEAVCIGMLACVIGSVLGYVLASSLLSLVVRTINDLYYSLNVTNIIVSPWTLIKAFVLGLGATVLAAAIPAFEATRVRPRIAMSIATLEQRLDQHAAGAWRISLILVLGGVACIYWPTTSLWPVFVGLLLLVFGIAIAVPTLMGKVLPYVSAVLGRAFGVLAGHASRAVLRSRSRTAVAVAALAVALAASLSISLMITSFRGSVDDWLASFLTSDIYLVRSDSNQALSNEFIADLRVHSQVDQLRLGRRRQITMGNVLVNLFALDTDEAGFFAFQFVDSPPHGLFDRWQSGDQVIVSEPFASRHRLSTGDHVTLNTINGPTRFNVGAIYRDYGSDQGVLTLPLSVYAREFDDLGASSAAIIAIDEANVQSLMSDIEQLSSAPQDLLLRSNVGIRELSLDVFDRTFAITGVIRTLAVIVAIIGIVVALMSIQYQRTQEYSLLRAIGLLPRDLVKLILMETGLMGLVAGLVALPLGVVMAYVLVNVINRRAFGWSMDFHLDLSLIIQALLMAIIAALVASVVPAYKLLKTQPAAGLRFE